MRAMLRRRFHAPLKGFHPPFASGGGVREDWLKGWLPERRVPDVDHAGDISFCCGRERERHLVLQSRLTNLRYQNKKAAKKSIEGKEMN
jgi:hypothetical protein